MATSLILLRQVAIMFLLAVIVKGFMVVRTPERMIGIAISMLLAVAVLGLCILPNSSRHVSAISSELMSAYSSSRFSR